MTLTAPEQSTAVLGNRNSFHCGEEMALIPLTGDLPVHAGLVGTWRCPCGYQMDAFSTPSVRAEVGFPGSVSITVDRDMQDSDSAPEDPLTAVVAAFSVVEKLQWELSSASLELEDAVLHAHASGADLHAISRAAELSIEEIRSIVGE